MSAPNELDEMYVLDDMQSPHEQVWASDSDIAGMQNTDPDDETGDHEPITLASGVLSFLDDVVDEVSSYLQEPEPRPAPGVKLDTIRTRELGSDKWRGRTLTVSVQASAAAIVNSDYRRSVTLVNYGANNVYVSSVPSAAGAPNTFILPPSTATLWAPLVLTTRDDVWLYVATGTAQVSVFETYDQEC